MKTIDAIRNIIADLLWMKPEEVTPDLDLTKYPCSADELDIIDIVMAVERKFNITIKDDDIDKLKTLNDFVKHVDKIMKENH